MRVLKLEEVARAIGPHCSDLTTCPDAMGEGGCRGERGELAVDACAEPPSHARRVNGCAHGHGRARRLAISAAHRAVATAPRGIAVSVGSIRAPVDRAKTVGRTRLQRSSKRPHCLLSRRDTTPSEKEAAIRSRAEFQLGMGLTPARHHSRPPFTNQTTGGPPS